MSRLDRFIISAILSGKLEFDKNPTFAPRFACIGDLRLVRTVTDRWCLITGLSHVGLSYTTHLCLECCRFGYQSQLKGGRQ